LLFHEKNHIFAIFFIKNYFKKRGGRVAKNDVDFRGVKGKATLYDMRGEGVQKFKFLGDVVLE
jgi:hypothetical protein